jgi:hypothetical protein
VSAATAPKPSSSTGYEVSRPHGKCFVSGRDIAPDEKFMAALRETPTGFERLDISMEHWAEFDRTNIIAFWQTAMPRQEQKKQVFVDDEVLSELFVRLADATEPAKLNFRFVLGLILMRKRLLTYEGSQTNEKNEEIWTLKPRGKDERLQMLNPHLTEQQVGEVSQQLSEILNENL